MPHVRGPRSSDKVILHAGPHKTGTTALQSFFSEHHQLLEAHGIHYPRAGRVYGGHHNLAWEILLDARFVRGNGGWAELLQELAPLQGQRRILLSSEDFSLIPIARLSQFFYSMEGLDLTVLWVYRPLRDFLESLHAEEVKNGMTLLSLEQFAIEKITFDHRLRVDRYFSLLIDTFGIRVAVIPYSGDVVASVAAYLDVGAGMPEKRYQANTRMAKDDLRRLLAHRRKHSHLNWFAYFQHYVAPRLRDNVEFEGEMVPEGEFALPEDLAKFLAARDERHIAFFRSREQIDYLTNSTDG